ncbi:MAG TPA: hypothetical protein VHZ26_04030 [Caulobacteraceae bacterium]|jgi:hypothetical protein|nr:hypothetical protein [Caulobacteraceae bacterium]
MRRIGFCLCLAVLAAALIGAAPAEQPTAPARPAAKVVRGGQGGRNPQNAQSGKTAKPTATLAPLAPAASPLSDASAADPGQCRMACDHSYYFCLSGQDAESCPETWTSCRTGCERSPIQP